MPSTSTSGKYFWPTRLKDPSTSSKSTFPTASNASPSTSMTSRNWESSSHMRKGNNFCSRYPWCYQLAGKNSPPIFSTATEIIADLPNQWITNSLHLPHPHHLDYKDENVPLPPADAPFNSLPTSAVDIATPPDRYLILPLYLMQGYIDIFIDNFVCLVQGNEPKRRVRRILLHSIDQISCPLDLVDNKFRQEPVSV